jgi:hypothetical protein
MENLQVQSLKKRIKELIKIYIFSCGLAPQILHDSPCINGLLLLQVPENVRFFSLDFDGNTCHC